MIKINPSILSKTVKVITPKTEKVEEAQIRGTIVYRNQEHFVQLDGAPSNALTPIAEFAQGASDAGFVHGDRVLVLIKNHQAIVTKNLTTGLQAQAAKEASAFTTAITDEGITAQRIIANDTFTNTLRANHITADEIIAGMATIDTLDANYAHITDGVIDNAKIGVADVNDLSANYAHITTGVIDNAKIDVADVNNLSANYAHITNGVIDNAKIGYADVNNLSANYAQINAANVTDLSAQNAWVNKIMVQTGLIAHEGAVFTLDAIQVNAANITAGTLDVNRLIVTVDGEKYLVEIDPTTHQPSYEKLDGGIVEPRTITADKIVAHDITVQEITTENLVGTNGWINLNQGKFFYGDGANFASATNAISWNGSKLQIKADEFLLSTGQTIQDSIESVENWFYSVPPTTSNPPANSWTTTNLKEQHLRDIYFDTTSGKSYRWSKDNNVYSWVEIEDVELAALAKDLHDNYPPRSEFTVAPNQIQAVVTNEANARKAIYGTCGTAAGTTAKVVTCANFARYTGAVVTVKFTNANTATVPTLNVNSTGAATIKSYTGAALAEAEYKWAAGATLTFVFDGTYWRLQDSGSTAQIKVNADNINLRVQKNDVINQINVSTEGAQIQAAKVDIAGAAVFNNYSTTTQMNTAIGNAVDGIEVGGRNYIVNSKSVDISLAPYTNSTAVAYSDAYGTEQYYYCSGARYIQVDFPTLIDGKQYTISFDIVRGSSLPVLLTLGSINENIGNTGVNAWARVKYTFTAASTITSAKIRVHNIDEESGRTDYIAAVKCIKLECGNKATDWTQAPEDVKAVHALDSAYLSTGATYATILGWCEDGGQHGFDIDTTSTPLTNVKVGDTVRIKYFANNMGTNGTMIYLVGTVLEFYGTNNSTVKLGSVSLESTVIDGGHILAGTIDTNRLNANTIKSQIVQTTELNADKITSGTISTSRLPSDALKTIRTIERNAGAPYASIKSWAAADPCQWTTVVDTTGVRVGDTCRLAIPVTDMSGVTAYITGTVTAVHSTTALTMTGQSISSTTIDGGMILTGTVAANRIDTNGITIGQSQVTDLSTDLNSIRAQYGYTNTAAATAVKEVVLPNYVDRQGAIIGVRFANGNTASSMKLNVNNTGEKSVQSVDILTDLPAATSANFIRDEYNQWRYLGSDASSKTSKTFAEALSSAKQISTQSRSFTKANWDSYGANGHTESWSANSASGYDNSHISVGDTAYITGTVSDKAGWYAAILGTVTSISSTAVVMTSIKVLYNSTQTEKYITKIDNNGIFISPLGQMPTTSAAGNSVKINASGMEVYKGGASVAFYGDSARIGKANSKRVELDSSSFAVVESNGIAQFSVDATSDSLSRSYTRYLDLTGGGFIAYARFVAPGIGSSIKVGAATAILNVKNAITTTLTLPTTIGATTTVTANNVTFAVTKEGKYVYELNASASSGTNYYAGFTYTTTYREALVSVNDSLINTQQHLYVPVYVSVGTLDDCTIATWGRVAQIRLEVHKSSVSSGSNVFEGILSDFIPIDDALICGYYGGRACPGKIDSGGGITVRNAGSSSVSPTASSPLIVLGTYIFDPTRTAW